MAAQGPLKHQLDGKAVERIAGIVKRAWPAFDSDRFHASAVAGLQALELKARVRHIISALAQTLPADFLQTAAILRRCVDGWERTDPSRNWADMSAWPLIDYVGVYGLDQPECALDLLERMTPLFTAEFAIRPLLQRHFGLSHARMLDWCGHDNAHVRRLACEGLRPRLPWAAQLPALRADPAPIWPVVQRLMRDDSVYVRRSVANTLNDIGKDHPRQLVARLRLWQQRGAVHEQILRQGLRSLLRQGYPGAHALLGYSEPPELAQLALQLEATRLESGDALTLRLDMAAGARPQTLRLDCRLRLLGGSGRSHRRCFRWRDVSLQPGQRCTLYKSQPVGGGATGELAPGPHRVELIVNGVMLAGAPFMLVSQ